MEIKIDISTSRVVLASPQRVYELLIDVADSVAHFPKVANLDKVGEFTWAWRMQKVGAGRISVQATYGVLYHNDPERLRIDWTPVEGMGNSRTSGIFQVEPAGSGARMTFTNTIVLDLPFPRVLRPVVQALCRRQNTALIEGYLDNLTRTLNGGDGRLSHAWFEAYTSRVGS